MTKEKLQDPKIHVQKWSLNFSGLYERSVHERHSLGTEAVEVLRRKLRHLRQDQDGAPGEPGKEVSPSYLKSLAHLPAPTRHCALGTILDLLYKSKTNGGKVIIFTPNYTFTKRNILVKKIWPLKARKAMLK